MLESQKSSSQSHLFKRSSAVFSKCENYRYRLDRVWDDSLPPLAFGMLNPSTADHEHNDPTVERCERRAKMLGFGSLIVWNLFAFRTSSPKILKKQSDPVGPDNDKYIRIALLEATSRGGQVIVGWGSNGNFCGRDMQITEIARKLAVNLYCLGITNGGHPKHPLYVAYLEKPLHWDTGMAHHATETHISTLRAAAPFVRNDLIPS